jgi:hypothetical protein
VLRCVIGIVSVEKRNDWVVDGITKVLKDPLGSVHIARYVHMKCNANTRNNQDDEKCPDGQRWDQTPPPKSPGY